MPRHRRLPDGLLVLGLILVPAPRLASAQSPATPPRLAASAGDGQQDFDFEIGTWKTNLSRLARPLSGSKEWVKYEGTTVVRKVWDGKANLVELDVTGPPGHIEALSLRLYNPERREWSLNFANSRLGVMTVPAVGRFRGNRGEFLNADSLDGKPILVRFVISIITPDSCHFEQSFSGDGGKTWEANWIATDVRLNGS